MGLSSGTARAICDSGCSDVENSMYQGVQPLPKVAAELNRTRRISLFEPFEHGVGSSETLGGSTNLDEKVRFAPYVFPSTVSGVNL